jgi:hypothetical protein
LIISRVVRARRARAAWAICMLCQSFSQSAAGPSEVVALVL